MSTRDRPESPSERVRLVSCEGGHPPPCRSVRTGAVTRKVLSDQRLPARSKAREDVLTQVRRRLAEQLQLSAEELQSLLRAVRSQLDVSLSTLLSRAD
jgi:hypothetical protein